MQIIKWQGQNVPAEYLGDGVYAIFDGFGIWLHANDHENPTDRVYLEPGVFQLLVQFEQLSKAKEVVEECRRRNESRTESVSGLPTSES